MMTALSGDLHPTNHFTRTQSNTIGRVIRICEQNPNIKPEVKILKYEP